MKVGYSLLLPWVCASPYLHHSSPASPSSPEFYLPLLLSLHSVAFHSLPSKIPRGYFLLLDVIRSITFPSRSGNRSSLSSGDNSSHLIIYKSSDCFRHSLSHFSSPRDFHLPRNLYSSLFISTSFSRPQSSLSYHR